MFIDRIEREAREKAEKLNPQPKALIVACEAAVKGGQAGIAEANRRAGGEKEFKQVAKGAGEMLMNIRKYAAASSMLTRHTARARPP